MNNRQYDCVEKGLPESLSENIETKIWGFLNPGKRQIAFLFFWFWISICETIRGHYTPGIPYILK